MPDYYMTFDVLVPDGTTHVAQDADGRWFAHSCKPEVGRVDGWVQRFGGISRYLCQGEENPNWHEACYEIERK